MPKDKLIRLAESHRSINYANDASVSAAKEIADSIMDALASASEIELVGYSEQKSLAQWVAFHVLEKPEKYPFLVGEATKQMELLANGDTPESFEAKKTLARLKNDA